MSVRQILRSEDVLEKYGESLAGKTGILEPHILILGLH